MQLTTWPLARLGSRFGMLFEPARRRVMHSALGRFLDGPLDLAVGLIEPDGTERVLPFTRSGKLLYACEQFESVNSVTYRGYSQKAGLCLELDIHSPFYPKDEKLCLLPVFYIEVRVTWAKKVRLRTFKEPPENVRIFLRLKWPRVKVAASEGKLEIAYGLRLDPRYSASCGNDEQTSSTDNIPINENAPVAHVFERIQSLNPGTRPTSTEEGYQGLELELPVGADSSGVKWRLVWGAHTADPILTVGDQPAKFRYHHHWPNLDAVMTSALENRDHYLALSRRFEKILEQVTLNRAQWHLLVMGFQSYLASTFWCTLKDGRNWFSVMEGTSMFHTPVDVEYNIALLYFVLWPDLLVFSFDQWTAHCTEHPESGGLIVNHDMGAGLRVTGMAYQPMPVEENTNYLLLMQAYSHWTGDLAPAKRHAKFLRRLAEYLLWTDRDNSGFPSEGTTNTLDGGDAVRLARKQTYLAIKRVGALDAAADLLARVGDDEGAERCRVAAAEATPKIEAEAWLTDHYAVSLDRDARSLVDVQTGKTMPTREMAGWDDYSLYTANGLLLPALTAQPLAFDRDHLVTDLQNAQRETLRHYGCAHTSSDQSNIWISANLWRDHIARYFHAKLYEIDTRYWDMLVFSNTGDQSLGYIDTYIANELAFYPRGATAFGYFLAGPRLQIDRLDGEYIAIHPDRHRPQRWPLLPLADWKAGKVPICVVEADGNVYIESEIKPVKILGQEPVQDAGVIG